MNTDNKDSLKDTFISSDNSDFTDEPTPLTDLNDEFISRPPIMITSDDLLKVAEIDTFLSPTYKRCDNCALRDAYPPCEFYEEGSICTIERNLFREYLRDLQSQGVDLSDRVLIMVGFIHLVSIWRNYTLEAAQDEHLSNSEQRFAELSKFRHKNISDHTKHLLSILRELQATRKERSKSSKGKKDKKSLASILSLDSSE